MASNKYKYHLFAERKNFVNRPIDFQNTGRRVNAKAT